MPENVLDEMMGTLHFAEQFEKRYGPAHPEFFAGTFEDALKESCLKPAKEVRVLRFLDVTRQVASNCRKIYRSSVHICCRENCWPYICITTAAY